MPTFIEVKCPCGRMLRARADQAGTAIQCWDCKAEVVVPHPDEPWLVGPMADAAFQALRAQGMAAIAGGAALITAVLLVPRAGLLLTLGLVAISVHLYGSQMRPLEQTGGAVAAPALGRRALLVQGALALLATLALVAPQVVRNQGHVLPPASTSPRFAWLAVLALAGWVVMPVAILAACAHDHHGPLSPRQALAALWRHPLATLAALAVLPIALVLTEGVLALFAWQQGHLPLLVVDLFPPPRFAYVDDGKHLYFHYGGTQLDKNYSESVDGLTAAYPLAFRHGYTLVGTVPPSLAIGLLEVRTNPWEYGVTPGSYLIHRIVFTFLTLAVSGVALLVQARWLGLIAAVGARRSSPSPG
jgi:hypothetical protein